MLKQSRNTLHIEDKLLTNIVTKNKEISPDRRIDILLGLIVQKYTQSNSINICFDGQTIGIGAGQQSRIYCTKIAIDKANAWFLRQTEKVLLNTQKLRMNRNEEDNYRIRQIEEMNTVEKEKLLKDAKEWTMVSDGYIPFRDNIDVCNKAHIKYIVQPGSSIRDEEIIKVSDEYGMVMIFTGKRLFQH